MLRPRSHLGMTTVEKGLNLLPPVLQGGKLQQQSIQMGHRQWQRLMPPLLDAASFHPWLLSQAKKTVLQWRRAMQAIFHQGMQPS